jgi:hypothetical protein
MRLFEEVGCRSGRVLVPARIFIGVDPFADFDDCEHSRHFQVAELRRHPPGDEVAGAGHLSVVFGEHTAHSRLSHRHVAWNETPDAGGDIALVDPEHVGAVAHAVHAGVVGDVAVHRPVAGIVCYELDFAGGSDGDVDGHIGPLRRLGEPFSRSPKLIQTCS